MSESSQTYHDNFRVYTPPPQLALQARDLQQEYSIVYQNPHFPATSTAGGPAGFTTIAPHPTATRGRLRVY